MNKSKWFAVLAGLVALIQSGCGLRRLDEAVLYEGPQFKLKVVRYYENLPFHYTGEVFSVQCSSPRTEDSPARSRQDAGWVQIGGGGAIGSSSAQELAERERPNYLIMDDSTLVKKDSGLGVTFDACGSFHRWDPTTLPTELIDPVEKPDHCAPGGAADCRHYDFLGDRQPRFEDIRTDPTGRVSFSVRSKSFKADVLRVDSDDFGKTWRVARASVP